MAVLCLVYVSSYFLCGSYDTGFTDVSAKRWYHDRRYAFNPVIYIPLAYVEQKLRGAGHKVLLDGSPARDGSVLYSFGP